MNKSIEGGLVKEEERERREREREGEREPASLARGS